MNLNLLPIVPKYWSFHNITLLIVITHGFPQYSLNQAILIPLMVLCKMLCKKPILIRLSFWALYNILCILNSHVIEYRFLLHSNIWWMKITIVKPVTHLAPPPCNACRPTCLWQKQWGTLCINLRHLLNSFWCLHKYRANYSIKITRWICPVGL